MANLLLTPDLMKYVDVLVDGRQMELALEHIKAHEASPLVGKSLRQVRVRETTGTLVVGINRTGEGLKFNPKGGETFQVGDVILAMGTHDGLNNLVRLARGEG